MKRIIIFLSAIITLLFTGCFIDSDTATVRINLGNIPVAKVEKKSLIDRFLMFFATEAVAQVPSGVTAVHIGAFDSNNQLLAKKSINVSAGEYPADNTVSLEVPAKSGVTIVVLGEVDLMPVANIQQISYYGKNEISLDLTAGAIVNIQIFADNLSTLVTSNYFNFRYLSEPVEFNAPIAWDRIIGSSSIDLEYNTSQVGTNFVTIYSGSELSCSNDQYDSANADEYQLTINFSFSGKSSSAIPMNIGL